MLVDCSNCRTQLQPPSSARSIRCALCHAVTHIADPRSVPPQPPSRVHAPPPPSWHSPSPYSGAPPPPSWHSRSPYSGAPPPPSWHSPSPHSGAPPPPSWHSRSPYSGAPPPPSWHSPSPYSGATPRSSWHSPSPYSGAPPPPSWHSPSPYSSAPPGPPPSPHGRKKALIVGISYRYSRHELKGCINDAKCMRYLLINKFKFPESSILMLTEEETDPYRIPTKHNMRMAMFWLVLGCQPGDSLVFHYSGHGSQQRNYSGDEADGFVQTLCPLHFETQGMIVDVEINATLVRPLPRGAKLHALIDACHSGTVLDLPFLCRMNRSAQYVWEDHRPRSGVWKGSSGGEVISFSGCDDHQSSADTSALSKITSTGAMTYCFIQAIERGHGATYGSILNSMRTAIRNVGNNGGSVGGDVVTTLVSMLVTGGSVGGGGLRQEPQLTACEPFDVYAKPFSW